MISDRSLTLTDSDAVFDESDQRKLTNYLLDQLIQRAVKEYWSEKNDVGHGALYSSSLLTLPATTVRFWMLPLTVIGRSDLLTFLSLA